MDSRKRVTIIIIAIVLALILFAAGLFSGLYVARSVEVRSRESLLSIERRQQEDVTLLTRYVDNLQRNLQKYQLQEQFINSLNTSQRCVLTETYFNHTIRDLNFYWAVLPSRLEEYERVNELDERYLTLKEEYTALSIRAWLIARDTTTECDSTVVPALYFYDANCEDCVAQGAQLDIVKQTIDARNQTFIAFTVDSLSNEPVISLIKQHYNITATPAIIIADTVLQGQVYSSAEVLQAGKVIE